MGRCDANQHRKHRVAFPIVQLSDRRNAEEVATKNHEETQETYFFRVVMSLRGSSALKHSLPPKNVVASVSFYASIPLHPS